MSKTRASDFGKCGPRLGGVLQETILHVDR